MTIDKTITICMGDVVPVDGRPCHRCVIKRDCYTPLTIHNYSEEQRQKLDDRLDYLRVLNNLRRLI